MDPIEIFRTGTHTDMHGRELTFTAADLAATAAAYDPALHEAPLVVGHPQTDAPAYGWVRSLAANGTLRADPDQVDPDFAELVRTGRYKKLSASFFLPDAASNPVPGVYYLRHVGFLGAAPPAVKGLKAVELAQDEEGVAEFGWAEQQNAGLWRSLRDWILAQFGVEAADQAVPGYAVGDLEETARDSPDSEEIPMYTQPEPREADMAEITITEEQLQERIQAGVNAALATRDAEFAERTQGLEARAADLEARGAQLDTREQQARQAGIQAFVDDLKAHGQCPPAWERMGLVAFLAGLDDADAVAFADADDAAPQTQLAFMREFLSGLPELVHFAEVVTADDEPVTAGAAGAGAKIQALVTQKRRAEPDLSYRAALDQVNFEHPELAELYLAEIRSGEAR